MNNRAKSPFELVHTDVWDPCRTASTLGFQYFVTFIDDYSRCTWLFLMKNRAKLFSIFQKFYAEIQTQFNIFIRVLRSDNAREYFSAPFTSFMSHHGILHERTKHIEVNCHFIREKIASGCVAISFVNSNDQLADIFTKPLRGPRIKYICNKLGAYDVYSPA